MGFIILVLLSYHNNMWGSEALATVRKDYLKVKFD